MNSTVSGTGGAPGDGSDREMQIAGEIAHAFLNTTQPLEVYRLALERVAPLVGATFACVFLRDKEGDLLRIAAAHNWPQEYATYLSEMRVRVGNGPTGKAVAEHRIVEVPDVFADPDLEDWWDSARELGFTSSVALPLAFQNRPVGALTFYFEQSDGTANADRQLLRLVADQLGATAEKAHLIEDLQRANTQLREQNVDLEIRYREAEEAKRLKNEFLANISHELRTPLTAILGYAFLLREGLSGSLEAEQGRAVQKIEAAGTSLMALIDDLLDLTHLKLGRTPVEPELCDASSLARTAVAAAPEPRDGVKILTELPETKILIHTDAELVLKILRNLLSNAVKFTHEGTITVRVRSERPSSGASRGPKVVWEVEDTGIGILPEHQQAIFDEFRQVDGSATRIFGGAGLGLALSRALARRLDGDIDVHSVPDEGSRFRLHLPSSVVHAGADLPEPAATTPE